MSLDLDHCINRRGTDSVKWEHFGRDVLPMWVADMDFQSPEPVIRALRERVDHGVFGYGCDPEELCELVVSRLNHLYGWEVSPDWIMFLPGVVTGFNLANQGIAGPGDALLVQTPVYPPILHAAATAGLVGQQMELTRLPNGDYVVDMDRFRAAMDERTRIFLLCNPHNPVGRVFRRDELEAMAQVCLERDVTIVSDEIHCDLVFSESRHIPIASLSPEIAARTVTLMAPSKTFNIAGLGCSFAVIPSAELRAKMVAARRGLVGHPDILAYTAATAAYRDGRLWLEELVRYLEANRDHLMQRVPECLPGVRISKAEGTYLAWLDCREAGIPGNPQEFFLREARVALNDGVTFGPGGEGFVRLNFGCPRRLLDEGLERMQQALARL